MRCSQSLVLKTVLGIAGLAAAACNSSGIVGPRDLARLAQAEARWEARPFADYSYEIRISCFCPPEINRWTRVSVRNGAVVDAEAVEPDPQFPITTIQWWQPIDSLFATLHRAMTTDSFSSVYARIVVDYDKELGYPVHIEYVEKPTVADAAATIDIRNVAPLN
jgi:hypothetical protein